MAPEATWSYASGNGGSGIPQPTSGGNCSSSYTNYNGCNGSSPHSIYNPPVLPFTTELSGNIVGTNDAASNGIQSPNNHAPVPSNPAGEFSEPS